MSVHPNIQLMQNVYDAFGRGDVDTAASYWTQDCTHHYPGRSPLSGSHSGLQATIDFAGKMFELCEGRLTMEVLDIGASDDFAYARVITSYARRTPAGEEKKVDMPFINIMRITDGKISEFWTYPADQYAMDEFWTD